MTRLPAGWRGAPLGDVCQVVSGATPRTGVREYWGGDTAWITPDDLSKDRSQTVFAGSRSLSQAGYESCSARLFPAGSVVFSSRAPIGYVAIAGKEMCTNQGCKTAVPPEYLDSKYLYHYLRWKTPDVESRASGTTFKEISGKRFSETELIWPPMEEQRRIVDILEDHLSRLQAASDLLSGISQQAQALIEVEANALVLDDLRHPGVASANSETRLASIEEIIGGDRRGVIIGPFGSSLKTSDYRDAGVPLVFVRNVRRGYFGPEGRRYVSGEKAAELSGHEVRSGDVVITKMGDPPGDAAVYREAQSGIVTADVIRLRPCEGFLAEYIVWAMRTPAVMEKVRLITRGVAQKKVSLSRFRSDVLIPTPSLSVQAQIVATLGGRTESISRLTDAASLAVLRGQQLTRALLAAAFSGQLNGSSAMAATLEELAGV